LVVTVIAVVIAVLILHHNGEGSSSAAATGPTTTQSANTTTTISVTGVPTTTTVPLVSPPEIRLQVLNGIGTGSYAGEFSTKLHATPGYNTLAPDNATATAQSSAIYIVTTGYLPEAKALAATVGLPASAIVQTTPPPSTAPIPAADLTKADLVLVIGPDLRSKA
jgi:hypothetical protein